MRRLLLFAAMAAVAHGEIHTMSLKQVVDRALTQNPEIVMARIDQQKAADAVGIAKDPFSPHLNVGSGLAYSNGFPLSIEGSAPAVFQAKANQSLFNRPQTFALAQARENARGASFASGSRRDDVVYRVVTLFIDVDRAGRLSDAARKQADSLQKVLESADARVQAGRDLPIVKQEASVNLLRARQRLLGLASDRDYGERSLAVALGYGAGDIVRPAEEERGPVAIPDTEEAALQVAFSGNKELKRLESNYQAKALEIKGSRAQRLPRVELVAQYALLTKYSNYDQYFAKFQRNNGQLGASIQVPLLGGSAWKATLAQGEDDRQHLRSEMEAQRNKISLDVHQSFLEMQKATLAGQLAKAELDLAHEQLSVLLARMNEGRASLKDVEEARFAEDEKWIAFQDSQFNAEKARLSILRQTGELSVALQ
ncbi:MAG: TolC family protein [Terriglobia bacterium]